MLSFPEVTRSMAHWSRLPPHVFHLQGAPVLFFPEGHRSEDGVMIGFKKGAFSVAVKAGVDVIPLTVLGTGERT